MTGDRTKTPCEAWRIARGLTREQLAFLIGYTTAAIRIFEQGRGDGKPISDASFKRYRLLCSTIDYDTLNWDFQTSRPVFEPSNPLVLAGRQYEEVEAPSANPDKINREFQEYCDNRREAARNARAVKTNRR